MQQTASFPGVVGHGQTRHMLHTALTRGRLHHALLMHGPRGVGKATLARGLACALLCPELPHQGCGVCNVCRRVLQGAHPDVVSLSPESPGAQIKVDQARDFALQRGHAPFEAAAHVAIIDPADGLGHQAANALLKTIEEPRPGVFFVLLATARSRVLGTLQSRSIPIELGPLSLADTRAVLDQQREQGADSPPVDAARLELAIQLSGGSPGGALDYLKDRALGDWIDLLGACERTCAAGAAGVFAGERAPLWSTWKRVSASVEIPEAEDGPPVAGSTVTKLAGGRSRKKAARKTRAKKSSAAAPKATARQQRLAAHRLADVWLVHLRDLLAGRGGLLPDTAPPRSPAHIARQVERLLSFKDRLGGNPNVRLALEMTLLEMSGQR